MHFWANENVRFFYLKKLYMLFQIVLDPIFWIKLCASRWVANFKSLFKNPEKSICFLKGQSGVSEMALKWSWPAGALYHANLPCKLQPYKLSANVQFQYILLYIYNAECTVVQEMKSASGKKLKDYAEWRRACKCTCNLSPLDSWRSGAREIFKLEYPAAKLHPCAHTCSSLTVYSIQ